jgi:hypothetical protein
VTERQGAQQDGDDGYWHGHVEMSRTLHGVSFRENDFFDISPLLLDCTLGRDLPFSLMIDAPARNTANNITSGTSIPTLPAINTPRKPS